MPQSRYPRTIAAAKRLDQDQWGFCDALLAECGPPSEDRTNNGGFEKLREAQQALANQGYEYDVNWLRQCRDVAHHFRMPLERHASISVRVHMAVGNPALLQRILDGLPEGQTLSLHRATELMRVYRMEQAEIWRAEHPEAAAAADAATNEEDNETDDEDEPAPPPRRSRPSIRHIPPAERPLPPVNHIRTMAAVSAALANADRSHRVGRETIRELEAHLSDLNQIDVDAIVEAALAAHNVWLQIANMVRQNRANQRGHIATAI